MGSGVLVLEVRKTSYPITNFRPTSFLLNSSLNTVCLSITSTTKVVLSGSTVSLQYEASIFKKPVLFIPRRILIQECENLLLVCDPPFGAFLDPLMRSIEALKQRHKEARYHGFIILLGCLRNSTITVSSAISFIVLRAQDRRHP